jgi:hypothetical protein
VVVDQVTNPGHAITFNDVYAGKTFARAASFRVFGCGGVTFTVTTGPTGPYVVITPGGALTVAHSPTLYQEARIWFGFTGGVPFTSAPAGTVTIRCNETSEEFMFTLRANTIPLPITDAVPTSEESNGTAEPAQCSRMAGVTWTWTWRPA